MAGDLVQEAVSMEWKDHSGSCCCKRHHFCSDVILQQAMSMQ